MTLSLEKDSHFTQKKQPFFINSWPLHKKTEKGKNGAEIVYHPHIDTLSSSLRAPSRLVQIAFP
jgi:hypothetical protein